MRVCANKYLCTCGVYVCIFMCKYVHVCTHVSILELYMCVCTRVTYAKSPVRANNHKNIHTHKCLHTHAHTRTRMHIYTTHTHMHINAIHTHMHINTIQAPVHLSGGFGAQLDTVDAPTERDRRGGGRGGSSTPRDKPSSASSSRGGSFKDSGPLGDDGGSNVSNRVVGGKWSGRGWGGQGSVGSMRDAPQGRVFRKVLAPELRSFVCVMLCLYLSSAVKLCQ